MFSVALAAFAKIAGPLITGWVAHLLAELADRLQGAFLGLKLPVEIKQAAVAIIAAAVAAVEMKTGAHFLTPGGTAADIFSHFDVNAIAGVLFAFALKHAQQLKATAKVTAQPPIH